MVGTIPTASQAALPAAPSARSAIATTAVVFSVGDTDSGVEGDDRHGNRLSHCSVCAT